MFRNVRERQSRPDSFRQGPSRHQDSLWIVCRSGDRACELVAASGHCADQIALRSKGGAQRRHLDPQDALLDDAARPDAPDQRVLVDHGSRRLQERHQDVEGSSPELDRLAVGEKLTPMRQHLKAAKRVGRQRFRGSIHGQAMAALSDFTGHLSCLFEPAEPIFTRFLQAPSVSLRGPRRRNSSMLTDHLKQLRSGSPDLVALGHAALRSWVSARSEVSRGTFPLRRLNASTRWALPSSSWGGTWAILNDA